MVSTNPASPFVIDVFRLGYYGGKGGRHLVRLGPFGGKVQRDPAVGIERLRECRWEPAAEFPIPVDWPSGVYVGKLTAERGGFQSYVIFIVRDDRACDFLFQCADATWSAYNRSPDHWSLYDPGTQRPTYATLPYGKTWRHGSFTCDSRLTGVTCTNTHGHGLFLSRQSLRAW